MSLATQKVIEAETLATASKPNKTKIKQLVLESLKTSEFAISLDPKNSDLHLNHILLLIRLSNLVEGSEKIILQEFQTTIKLDPQNPRVFLELARFQFKNQKFNDAETNIKYALSLKNDYSAAWFDLYQTEDALSEQAKIIGNKTLEEGYVKKKIEALNETKRLVCEVNYSLEDCIKISKTVDQ
jgi:hypothetical protein